MLIYSISNHEYDIYMSYSLALISRERNSNGWLNGIVDILIIAILLWLLLGIAFILGGM